MLDLMMMMWETDKHHHTMMAGQLSGMVYEMFDDPPPGTPASERRHLKLTNDIEAELIRLEGKPMALHSGFGPIVFATSLAPGNEGEALKAIAAFINRLSDAIGDMITILTSAHHKTLDLRSLLVDTPK